MTIRSERPWLNVFLGVLCVAAIVVAATIVGPSSASTPVATRRASVGYGVVQSTVSGSGSLQAASQLDLGFKTAGTVTHIYVTQGEHVTQGQLLATLDPQGAEVTLEQAKAQLLAAEAELAKVEETGGEGSSAQSSTGQSSTGSEGARASAAVAHAASVEETVTANPAEAPSSSTTGQPETTVSTSQTTTSTVTATVTSTRTSQAGQPHSSLQRQASDANREQRSAQASSSPASSSGGSSSSPSASVTVSPATREANLASARAAVKSAKLGVQSDEQAVQDAKLYAPESGTIVSLSGQVGEVVSGSGTTRDQSSSSSSESGGSGSVGASASAARGASSGGAGSSDSGGSGSSSSAFAVLSDLSSMKLVVPLSESEVGQVSDGQIATVSVEALDGRKLAAHVSQIATLPTSNSGVVSYDVTFQLDQMESGLKPGMSATAEVVVKQAEGLNVPTSAITAGTVTVVRDGKQVRQRVVTGLAGNSTTLILSGLHAGEQVVLPLASSSATNLLTRAAGAFGRGGGGLGGAAIGGGLGAAGGAPVFFRGAG